MFWNFRVFSSYIIFCTLVYNLVSSDDIPTVLWNIKGSSLTMKPVSALGNSDLIFSESLNEIFLQGGSVLVFAVNKLSLEDFSSANEKSTTLNNTLYNTEKFLDVHQHMLLPSVKDPLNYIHKAHCGVQEIVVDNKIDKNVIQSVSKAMEKSCVVILHVSDDGIISKEEERMSVFLPALGTTKKNFVGVFTGVKSSWGAPDNDHHVSRNLLAVQAENDHFLNITGCLIMYASNITVFVENEGNGTELPFPPKLDGSSCNSSVLQLQFEPKGNLNSVTLIFNFAIRGNSWVVNNTVITVVGEKVDYSEVELNSETIDASLGYSYSCGNLVLNPTNATFKVKVELSDFQVQPYQVNGAFSDSFDCVPFFTAPIWMGIFVGILFIVILEIGIYALFSVHTMDRFDDPKGKTITVAATNE